MAHADVAAEAVGLEHAGFIVVMTGDEVRIEVRCKFEIGVAEPVHPHHEPGILDVRLDQPEVRTQANKEHDGKHQEREDAKAAGRSPVACATRESATTVAERTVRKVPVRLKISFQVMLRVASRLQCSVARICARRAAWAPL